MRSIQRGNEEENGRDNEGWIDARCDGGSNEPRRVEIECELREFSRSAMSGSAAQSGWPVLQCKQRGKVENVLRRVGHAWMHGETVD